MLAIAPKLAWDEIADAIGILRDGTLVFDTIDEGSVLGDCILYNWFQHGKNVVQQFASTHVMKPGSDEEVMLRACLSAKYRILGVRSLVPGAGLVCKDLQNDGEIFLMDVAMSQHAPAGYLFATRTFPFEEYWITGGASLPIDFETDIDEAFRQLKIDYPGLLGDQDGIALAIVRACLAAGAAQRIRYEVPSPSPAKRQRIGHLPPKKPRRL